MCNHNIFKYKCGSEYCSKDEPTCTHFRVIKSIVETKSYRIRNKNITQDFRNLLAHIKPCVSNQIKFKSENVCFNPRNCFIRMPFESIYVRVSCACKKSFKINCNNDYCAKDMNSCKNLKYFIDSKQLNKSIRNCPYPM